MKNLIATKIRTLVNGITVWQISTADGKIIMDTSYRGIDESAKNLLEEFKKYIKTQAHHSAVVHSYYKNALNN